MCAQVMALVAHLMQHKNNYGPHLIIVPNAVMVNWKSELTQWLPSVRCVYYVGHKDERARKFATEVASLQFNVLVTTYEYIMRDRAKLSKVNGPPALSVLPAVSISPVGAGRKCQAPLCSVLHGSHCCPVANM